MRVDATQWRQKEDIAHILDFNKFCGYAPFWLFLDAPGVLRLPRCLLRKSEGGGPGMEAKTVQRLSPAITCHHGAAQKIRGGLPMIRR